MENETLNISVNLSDVPQQYANEIKSLRQTNAILKEEIQDLKLRNESLKKQQSIWKEMETQLAEELPITTTKETHPISKT